MFRVCITISLILLPFVFGETPALCSLCKYGTCNNNGECICDNEVQGIFCNESFADVLGGAYIGYQVFALVLSSILFIGGISLVVLTGLWKVQVERAQTGAMGVLTFGLLSRVLYFAIKLTSLRHTYGIVYLLTPFVAALCCDFWLQISLWSQLYFSMQKNSRIEPEKSRKFFYSSCVVVFTLDALVAIIGFPLKAPADLIANIFWAISFFWSCLLSIALTAVAPKTLLLLYRAGIASKSDSSKLTFKKATFFMIWLAIVWIANFIWVAIYLFSQGWKNPTFWITMEFINRILEALTVLPLFFNYFNVVAGQRAKKTATIELTPSHSRVSKSMFDPINSS